MKKSSLLLSIACSALLLPIHLKAFTGCCDGPPEPWEFSLCYFNIEWPEDETECCGCDPCQEDEIDEDTIFDPIAYSGGKFYLPVYDVVIPGPARATNVNLMFLRTYSNQDNFVAGVLPKGWVTNLDVSLQQVGSGSSANYIFREGNGKLRYLNTGNGYLPSGAWGSGNFGDGIHCSLQTISQFGMSGQYYVVTKPFGTRFYFDFGTMKIAQIRDRNGQGLVYNWNNGKVASITEGIAGGRSLVFSYLGNGKLNTVTDNTGRVWTYQYDGTGRLWKVIDPYKPTINSPNRFTEYGYNGIDAWNITSVKDWNGDTTTYGYDGSDRTISRKIGSFGTRIFSYDGLGNTTVTKEDSQTWTFTSGLHGAASSLTSPDGQRGYTFDAVNKRISSVTDELGRTRTFGYSSTGQRNSIAFSSDNTTASWTYPVGKRYWTSFTDRRGKNWQRTLDPATSAVTKMTDAMGKETNYVRNTLGLATKTTDATGVFVDSAYNAFGDLISTTTSAGVKTLHEWDSLGRLVRTISVHFTATPTATDISNKTITFPVETLSHLAVGMAIRGIGVPANSSITAIDLATGVVTLSHAPTAPITTAVDAGHPTTHEHDTAGRVIKTTLPTGKFTESTYDLGGNRLTHKDEHGKTTTYTYNCIGQVLTAVDPAGKTSTAVYDASSRLEKVTPPAGAPKKVTYDAKGRRHKVWRLDTATTPPTETREITINYNPADEITSMVDEFNQSTGFDWNAATRTKTVTYPDLTTEVSVMDANGNMTSFTNRATQLREKTYDDCNRLSSQNCPTCGASFTYDDAGRLIGVVDANAGAFTFEYDVHGRLKNEIQPGGTAHPQGWTVEYAYDLHGRLGTFTDPNGSTVDYTYNSRNLTQTITYGGSEAWQFGYDDAGRRTSLSLPNAGTAEWSYHGDSGTLSAVEWRSLNPVYQTTEQIYFGEYGYDDNHRLTGKWESSSYFGILYTDFLYDAQNRLTHRNVDSVDFWTDSFSESFSYDAVGNRTSTTYDGYPTSYSPVTWNLYSVIGASSQSYDSNRNLIDDGVRSMVHDADDRLTSCTKNGVTTTYVYDWQNRLITRTTGGQTTRFIYRGWHVVAEVNESYGAVSRTYIHGTRTDEIMAYVDAAGNMHHLCTDHQGSTVAVVDQYGVPEEFYFYSAFGMLQGNSSPMVNYLFTGREYEPSTGLYNYRNRYYHPEQGRFLQPDPIRFGGGDVNLYAYCGNDPVNFVDPFGLTPKGNIKQDEFRGCTDEEIKQRYKELSDKGRLTPEETKMKEKLKTEEKARGIRPTRNDSEANPQPTPTPQQIPQSAPCPKAEETSWWQSCRKEISEATGLTGTALLVYIVISEGSRLFPPRNLIPVP